MRMKRVAWSALLSAPLLLASAGARAQDLAPPSTETPTGSATPTPPDDTSPAPSKPVGHPAPSASPTSQDSSSKLADQEKKDSKRGLEWLYVLADGGFAYANMASLSHSNLMVQNASSSGPALGLSAGIRLLFLQLGVRANFNALSSFDLWQMDAELGFHIPIGHVEPYFGFHGGYCFVASLDDGLSGGGAPSITGGDAGLQLGFDYYFNHYVSLGVEVGGNLLFLHGSPPALPDGLTLSDIPANQRQTYEQSGDSVGLGVTTSLHLGFHL